MAVLQAVALLAGTVLTPEPSPETAGVLAQGCSIRRLLPDRDATCQLPTYSARLDVRVED